MADEILIPVHKLFIIINILVVNEV